MRIGEVATLASVRAATVRYYEKRGLLVPPPRTSAGYRVYSAQTAGQLRLIRWAQSLGFTLREIRELVQVAHDHASGRGSRVRRRAKLKLHEIDLKMRQLQAIRAQLEALVVCRCRGDCPILTQARTSARPQTERRR